MICRKCGNVLEEGLMCCPFCGESITSGMEGDVRNKVELKALAEVPKDKERLLSELHRLKKYFLAIRGKYGVMEDLWLMQLKWQEPSLLHWSLGGFLVTAAVYLVIYGAGLLPQVAMSFFFVLWGSITSAGYIRSGRIYEARKARIAKDICEVENDVRNYYNQAADCFLPLDYSDPRVIGELIDGIKSGTIQSFQDYRIS